MSEQGKRYLRVVNWETYQHYRDRNPPWIKLHNCLLEDPAVAALPDAMKAHLYGVWLLASRLGNKIPADAAFIGKRINATTKVDLKALILLGFLEPHPECKQFASNPLATCTTETEERQSREETETEAPPPAIPSAESISRRGWTAEAIDDHRELRGEPTAGKLVRALKPLVDRHEWAVVRPVWRSWLSSEEGKYGPHNFAANFLALLKPPAKVGKLSVGDLAMAEAAKFLGGTGDRKN